MYPQGDRTAEYSCIYKSGDQTWFLNEGAAAEARVAELGGTFNYVDAKMNPEEFLKAIDNAIANEADGIVACVPDQTMSQAVVDKCEQAGIPIVAADDALEVDGEIDKLTELLPDLEESRIYRADYDGTTDKGNTAAASVITAHPEITKWIVTGANEEGCIGAGSIDVLMQLINGEEPEMETVVPAIVSRRKTIKKLWEQPQNKQQKRNSLLFHFSNSLSLLKNAGVRKFNSLIPAVYFCNIKIGAK